MTEMNKRKVFHHLLGILFTVAVVSLGIPDASAVVKNVNLVDSNGRPLKNELVSVEKADGTAVGERTTDEKGILKFNFPEAGEYVVKDSNGSVLKKLEVSKVGTATWVLAELGLGAAVLVASNDNIFGSGSKISSSGGGGTGVNPVNGNYQIQFLLAAGGNPGNLPDLLASVNVNVTAQAPLTITQITTDPNFADMSGTLNKNSLTFTAIGIGTYNSVQTEFTMQGTFNVTTTPKIVTGTYSAGTDGTLPGGQAIQYNFNGVAF